MAGGRVVHVLGGEDYDVYVGRANNRYGLKKSFWANPFKVTPARTASQACFLYEQHARNLHLMAGYYEQHLEHLDGLTLACWCAPKDGALTLEDPEICHAQVLLRLAKEFAEEE